MFICGPSTTYIECKSAICLIKSLDGPHPSFQCQGCIQDFFLWGGGTHISAASRGLVACFPRKFFVFYVGL